MTKLFELSTSAARKLAGAAVLAASPALAEAPGQDPPFAPHRAIYEISMDHTTPGSGVAAVSGRIVYELTGSSCEGFAQNMRFVTNTQNQDGEGQLTDLRTSSWEQVPPKRLRFSTSTYQNDQLAEQTQGSATRSAPGAPVSVELTRPTKKKSELQGSVYFPIQHSFAVIAAARAGRHMLKADLYDGSETGEKVYTTSTAIGSAIRPGASKTLANLKDGSKLESVPSWPVLVSYYEQGESAGKTDAVPLYEMSYRFHENGVTSEIKIDHGEFALKAELKELVYLEAGKCDAGKP